MIQPINLYRHHEPYFSKAAFAKMAASALIATTTFFSINSIYRDSDSTDNRHIILKNIHAAQRDPISGCSTTCTLDGLLRDPMGFNTTTTSAAEKSCNKSSFLDLIKCHNPEEPTPPISGRECDVQLNPFNQFGDTPVKPSDCKVKEEALREFSSSPGLELLYQVRNALKTGIVPTGKALLFINALYEFNKENPLPKHSVVFHMAPNFNYPLNKENLRYGSYGGVLNKDGFFEPESIRGGAVLKAFGNILGMIVKQTPGTDLRLGYINGMLNPTVTETVIAPAGPPFKEVYRSNEPFAYKARLKMIQLITNNKVIPLTASSLLTYLQTFQSTDQLEVNGVYTDDGANGLPELLTVNLENRKSITPQTIIEFSEQLLKSTGEKSLATISIETKDVEKKLEKFIKNLKKEVPRSDNVNLDGVAIYAAT